MTYWLQFSLILLSLLFVSYLFFSTLVLFVGAKKGCPNLCDGGCPVYISHCRFHSFVCKWMNEQVNKKLSDVCVCACGCEWMSKWIKWMNARMNEQVNTKWMNEQVNKKLSDVCVCVCVCENRVREHTCLPLPRTSFTSGGHSRPCTHKSVQWGLCLL